MQDITRQIGIALRWLPLIVVGAVVSALIAFSWASGQPKVYESTARLAVEPGPDPSLADLAAMESLATRWADLAVSRPVAVSVIQELGLDEGPTGLRERLTTEVSEDSLTISLAARDGDPDTARRIARAVGAETRQRVRDELITPEVQAANRAISDTEDLIKTLERRLNTLLNKPNKNAQDRSEIISLTSELTAMRRDIQFLRDDSRGSVRGLLGWFDPPRTPTDPIEPRPLYWTLLALVAGGMLAAGVAFVLEYLRNHGRVREIEDLEAATGLIALGSVAENRRDTKRRDPARLVVLRYPRGDSAEAYRGLLGRIGFAGGTARTLLVASADDSDAKSVVAANLALAYAEAGRNVILVDADYRSPRLHDFFGVRNDRGLTTVLADSDVPLGWVTVATSHPRLGLMPSGPLPTESSDPLGSPQLAALLRRLLHAADMVVFDSPSMAGNLDAAVLATHLQESLLVVTAGSQDQQAEDAARALLGAEADVVGTVLYRQVRRSRRGRGRAVLPPPAGQAPQSPQSLPRRIPVSVTRGGAAGSQNQPGPNRSNGSGASQPQAPVSSNDAALPRPPTPARSNGSGVPHQSDAGSPNGATPPRPPVPSGPYNVPFGAHQDSTKR